MPIDIFNPTPAAPPQGQQTSPGNLPPEAGKTVEPPPGADPNGVLPEAAATPESEPAPMAEFGELWENKPTKEGEGKPTSMFAGLTAETFQSAAKKMDFGKVVTPEHMTAITEGGEGAANAFLEVINLMGQAVYAQSSYANTRLMEKGLGHARTDFLGELPTHVNSLHAANTRAETNPILSNPATAPIIGAVEKQLSSKYPDATASELTIMAEKYLTQFADVIQQPGKEKKQQETQEEGEDWDAFLQM